MARKNKHFTAIILGGLVLVTSLVVLWSSRRVSDEEREVRRGRVLPTLRRDRIARIRIAGSDTFELIKDANQWFVAVNNRRFPADTSEVEHIVAELDAVEPSRRLGRVDDQARNRFGLRNPRSRVTFFENENISTTIAVGALISYESTAYVEAEGQAFVIPQSVSELLVRPAFSLREKSLSDLGVARIARIDVEQTQSSPQSPQSEPRRRFVHDGNVWRLEEPNNGRVLRARMDAILRGLQELAATRFLADGADDATLQRYGLSSPQWTITAVRDQDGGRHVWRFGAPCPDFPDEITVTKGESRVIACTSRSVIDEITRPAQSLQDDKIIWTRADEAETIKVHTPDREFTLRRNEGSWRLEGDTNNSTTIDSESTDGWLTALSGLLVEQRRDGAEASAHGLSPANYWFEVTRTGEQGSERVNVGEISNNRMYAQRGGETSVLEFSGSVIDTLRVDIARFRSRNIIRDVTDQLTAMTTETPTFQDEILRTDGTYRLTRPFDALADPTVVRAGAERLASLQADRWVSASVRPEYGLDHPRVRVTARFEGSGPDPDPDDRLPDGGSRHPIGRVREYTLTVGAVSLDTLGAYASISGQTGVFVIPREVVEDLLQPKIQREILTLDRARVSSIEITRNVTSPERFLLQRNGETWTRSPSNQPADAGRVNVLLDQLASVRAPRVFGYGAAPTEATMGTIRCVLTLRNSTQNSDAATPTTETIALVLGVPFGLGSDSGAYARREGIDATLSVPRDVYERLRDFQP